MGLVRILILGLGILLLIGGMAFLWSALPFPFFYFIGATLLGYALSLLWIGTLQAYHALLGAGLAGSVAFGGIAVYGLGLTERQFLSSFSSELCLYGGMLCLWFCLLGLKSKKQPEKIPREVRYLFGLVFTLALLEAVYLLAPAPDHFIWVLSREESTVFGWMALGIALFFGWGIREATWENAYPLLYSLLLYDVLLIGPLFQLIASPPPVIVVPFLLWTAIGVVCITGIWSGALLLQRLLLLRNR